MSERAARWAVAIALSMLASGVLAVYTALFWFDPCGNEPLAEYPSPDGQLRLVVFQRDCGATTGFSTQASILAHGAPLPNQPGNAWIAEAGQRAAACGQRSGPALHVTWISPRSITLHHDGATHVLLAPRQAQGVRIAHHATP